MELSIVIINWNVKEALKNCLTSIYNNSKNVQLEILVVDNASSDGSGDMVKKFFPKTNLIENTENLGFPKACNLGIKASKGDFILLLNSDTIVLPMTLDKAVTFMKVHPDIGALGCKLLNKDGTIQYEGGRNFPSLYSMFIESFYLHMLFPKSKFFAKRLMGYWNHEDDREVPCLSGSFMMLRKKAVDEVGLLDEQFQGWFEDMDYCFRLHKNSWKIFYLGSTAIIHIGGLSANKSDKKLWRFWGPINWFFFYKYHGRGAAEIFRLIAIMRASFRIIVAMVLYPFFHYTRFKYKLGKLLEFNRHFSILKWARSKSKKTNLMF